MTLQQNLMKTIIDHDLDHFMKHNHIPLEDKDIMLQDMAENPDTYTELIDEYTHSRYDISDLNLKSESEI